MYWSEREELASRDWRRLCNEAKKDSCVVGLGCGECGDDGGREPDEVLVLVPLCDPSLATVDEFEEMGTGCEMDVGTGGPGVLVTFCNAIGGCHPLLGAGDGGDEAVGMSTCVEGSLVRA